MLSVKWKRSQKEGQISIRLKVWPVFQNPTKTVTGGRPVCDIQDKFRGSGSHTHCCLRRSRTEVISLFCGLKWACNNLDYRHRGTKMSFHSKTHEWGRPAIVLSLQSSMRRRASAGRKESHPFISFLRGSYRYCGEKETSASSSSLDWTDWWLNSSNLLALKIVIIAECRCFFEQIAALTNSLHKASLLHLQGSRMNEISLIRLAKFHQKTFFTRFHFHLPVSCYKNTDCCKPQKTRRNTRSDRKPRGGWSRS